ncbi:hypothetical protein DS834_07965 [Lactobacillus bombicola]|uniref:CAAX prenyl protease 2/Lysostaphin resistance protein A-like domain-containing protein n=1 Tax=Lactobacillus bombicola TaxID=1505723 RepID=A0ABX9LST9_9LACO|nr:type II CAAX endopeptidase family protein [Lactobacillus bombicola]RHW49260.1 hypothetical protein DS834_07965 [Lactobacillus bombicola]
MKFIKNKLLVAGIGTFQLLVAFIMYFIDQELFLSAAITKLSWSILLVTLTITSILLWFIINMYQDRLKRVNPRLLNLSPHWDYKRLIWALIGILLILTVQLICSNLNYYSSSINQTTLQNLQKNTNSIFNILLVIVGPFFEELIFRGIFFNYFFLNPNKISNILGILTNGILFGVCHQSNIINLNFVNYAICGCILAAIYLKTRDLRYSYLCHLANNLLALITII